MLYDMLVLTVLIELEVNELFIELFPSECLQVVEYIAFLKVFNIPHLFLP